MKRLQRVVNGHWPKLFIQTPAKVGISIPSPSVCRCAPVFPGPDARTARGLSRSRAWCMRSDGALYQMEMMRRKGSLTTHLAQNEEQWGRSWRGRKSSPEMYRVRIAGAIKQSDVNEEATRNRSITCDIPSITAVWARDSRLPESPTITHLGPEYSTTSGDHVASSAPPDHGS